MDGSRLLIPFLQALLEHSLYIRLCAGLLGQRGRWGPVPVFREHSDNRGVQSYPRWKVLRIGMDKVLRGSGKGIWFPGPWGGNRDGLLEGNHLIREFSETSRQRHGGRGARRTERSLWLPFPVPSSLGYKMQNLRVTSEILSWYQTHLTLFPILSLFISSPFSKGLASQ